MKEWYLIGNKTKPNMLGGYENQSFVDYKEDAFSESLETDIASTILLFNHDLSQSIELRGIIQGNVADSSLKSMERCILVPIGTLHSGNYIFFEDEYWLVDGRPGNNGEYEKAVLKECQYKIKWQKDDGTIIERWANFTSASKYDVGESGNSTIILSSNNFTILIPHDADGLTIDGKRIFVDSSEIPKKVFKITRNDDVLFLHGSHGGTLSLIADKTELNPNRDNQELRICDYIDPSSPLPPTPLEPDETTDLRCVIKGTYYTLRAMYKRNYTVTFTDKDSNEIDWNTVDYQWNVVADFPVKQTITDNKITVSVGNEDLIGSSFLLQIIANGSVLSEVKIDIVE